MRCGVHSLDMRIADAINARQQTAHMIATRRIIKQMNFIYYNGTQTGKSLGAG